MKPFIILFAFLLVALPVWGQTQPLPYPPCRAPVVELRVDTPTVKRGSEPVATVLLRNEGTQQIRLVDLRRPELRIPSMEVKFLRNGSVLNLPRWFLDPGPINPRRAITCFFRQARKCGSP